MNTKLVAAYALLCLLVKCPTVPAASVSLIGSLGDGYKPISQALEDEGLSVRVLDSVRESGPWGPGTLDECDLTIVLPAEYPPELRRVLLDYAVGGGRLLVLLPERPVVTLSKFCGELGIPAVRQSMIPRGAPGQYKGVCGHVEPFGRAVAGGWAGAPFFLYTGWRLVPPKGEHEVLARTTDRLSDGAWRESGEPVIIRRKVGQGSATVALDFVGPEHLLWDLSGESLYMFVNLARDEVGMSPAAGPPGRFAGYLPGADRRIRTRYRILIVPARYSFPAHPAVIARTLAERVREETGLILDVEVAPPVEPAAASDEYPHPYAFYADVRNRVEADLSECDMLAVLTSDTLPAFNTDSRSYLGVWFSRRNGETGPYGAVIAGGSDEAPGAQWDPQARAWVAGERKRTATLGVRGIVHALMHEFGHHIGFPDYVAPPPHIMSGYYRDSRLEYCDLFKERLCAAMLSLAAAGLADADLDEGTRAELERLLAIGRRHQLRGSPRSGMDAAVRVAGRLGLSAAGPAPGPPGAD